MLHGQTQSQSEIYFLTCAYGGLVSRGVSIVAICWSHTMSLLDFSDQNLCQCLLQSTNLAITSQNKFALYKNFMRLTRQRFVNLIDPVGQRMTRIKTCEPKICRLYLRGFIWNLEPLGIFFFNLSS